MTHLARERARAYGIRIILWGALMASATSAFAQTSPVETIVVTATRSEDTAAGIAPTAAPLDAIQPTSILSQDYIAKNLPLSGNYDEAIGISPSVFDTAPNGPGLAESQNISIRGFQDGQFNATFDGIPWNDANDFTHHSTSYFMAHDLGEISVDRGPGTAATIGNATFGGTVSMLSKAPDGDMSITPYASFGSFNTLLYGGEVDTGAIDSTDGTRVMFDTELLKSDGYLTNMALTRSNAFLKVVQPLGNNTTLTVAAMYNNLHQDISLGATAAQIATLGPNWALSTDPTSQNYYGYNFDRISTDFEYADLESTFGDGWSLDTKLYTYAYFHHGLNGEDPNGEFPNGTCVGTNPGMGQCAGSTGVYYPNDVPGQSLTNDYRSIGTIARLTKEFSFGDIKTGIWYDRQINTRSLFEVDMTQGGVLNYNPDTGLPDPSNATDRNLHQTLTTIQPYLQVDWNTPIENLTVSPGVRYSYFDRSVNPIVDVKSGLGTPYDLTFDAILPSAVAHYTIDPDWTAYAQVAEGFLAPNENFFNRGTGVNPASINVSPEESWNYQAGTSVQLPNLTASADIYYIDFSNFITSNVVGGQTIYSNAGGVIYKGIEGEATYMLGYGFSVYANATLNSAKDLTTHFWIANAPETTGALGLIYDHDGLYGSIISKWVGSRYGQVGPNIGLSPLLTVDGALGYDLGHFVDTLKGISLNLQVYNITDVKKIINVAGATVQDGTPLYWTQPGRSMFGSISVKF
jgi:iron complex outermembrane receptor protein